MEILCNGTANEIYHLVKPKLQRYQKEHKLQIEEVHFDDHKLGATARGRGFKATIQCLDNCVKINLDLNILLRPVRSKIEAGIRQNFERILGSA